MRGKGGGIQKGLIRNLLQLPAACLQNDMRSGHVIGMEPQIPSTGETERKLVVLQIVFTNVDVKTVPAHIVKRLALRQAVLLRTLAACSSPADEMALRELLPNCGDVTLVC